ncbi:hypothetical protein B7486_55330 [cyanobacterium TDX16]|nr:hypothetical protein B7486_55330 [cyanobacterium TDX16]
MAVAELRTLTADEVLALPVPDLGLAALVDWYETKQYSGIQWAKGHHKRLGKRDEVRLALLEAFQWMINQGYLAPDLNTTSHAHYFVTRLGKQALGVTS